MKKIIKGITEKLEKEGYEFEITKTSNDWLKYYIQLFETTTEQKEMFKEYDQKIKKLNNILESDWALFVILLPVTIIDILKNILDNVMRNYIFEITILFIIWTSLTIIFHVLFMCKRHDIEWLKKEKFTYFANSKINFNNKGGFIMTAQKILEELKNQEINTEMLGKKVYFKIMTEVEDAIHTGKDVLKIDINPCNYIDEDFFELTDEKKKEITSRVMDYVIDRLEADGYIFRAINGNAKLFIEIYLLKLTEEQSKAISKFDNLIEKLDIQNNIHLAGVMGSIICAILFTIFMVLFTNEIILFLLILSVISGCLFTFLAVKSDNAFSDTKSLKFDYVKSQDLTLVTQDNFEEDGFTYYGLKKKDNSSEN